MAKVALVECKTYDAKTVKSAVERGINLLGGIENFAAPNEKILLKPNLLAGDVPEKCVTTHPAVFQAVAEIFLSTKAAIEFGDSPAVGNTKAVARRAGILKVANQLGIKLADFKNGKDIFFEQGIQNRKFTIARGVLDKDAIISIPKLKTHALEKMTGCVKNQFGCIPGLLKGEFHVRLPNAHEFGKMLVDLNNFIKPRLYIMDGIQAMEGNGPRGGRPIPMNILLFSTDPIALDATVCRIVNIDPAFVPTIKYGAETGAGTYFEDEIRLLGASIEKFKNTKFDIKREPIKPFNNKLKGTTHFLNNHLVPKPKIIKDKCTMCGTCVAMCPVLPKAVNWSQNDKSKPPVYDYDLCIRCYCCQEVCPENAIWLKKPLIRKLIDVGRS